MTSINRWSIKLLSPKWLTIVSPGINISVIESLLNSLICVLLRRIYLVQRDFKAWSQILLTTSWNKPLHSIYSHLERRRPVNSMQFNDSYFPFIRELSAKITHPSCPFCHTAVIIHELGQNPEVRVFHDHDRRWARPGARCTRACLSRRASSKTSALVACSNAPLVLSEGKQFPHDCIVSLLIQISGYKTFGNLLLTKLKSIQVYWTGNGINNAKRPLFPDPPLIYIMTHRPEWISAWGMDARVSLWKSFFCMGGTGGGEGKPPKCTDTKTIHVR